MVMLEALWSAMTWLARDIAGSPLGRTASKLAQRWQGTFYEGPEPPPRLDQPVHTYAWLYPKATVGEWMALAVMHGRECYKQGYIRGLESAERDLEMRAEELPPEEVALLTAHHNESGWLAMQPTAEQMLQTVLTTPEEREEAAAALNRDALRMTDGIRVQVIPVHDQKER